MKWHHILFGLLLCGVLASCQSHTKPGKAACGCTPECECTAKSPDTCTCGTHGKDAT